MANATVALHWISRNFPSCTACRTSDKLMVCKSCRSVSATPTSSSAAAASLRSCCCCDAASRRHTVLRHVGVRPAHAAVHVGAVPSQKLQPRTVQARFFEDFATGRLEGRLRGFNDAPDNGVRVATLQGVLGLAKDEKLGLLLVLLLSLFWVVGASMSTLIRLW